ncbi:phosphomannomutase [Sagittula sp. SSi028]|uniref:phosphomannomutase n=1 Tax=Sagittula sp. SSi028 TaxID=3400636 RepID=UPI003AF8DB7E
MAPKFGTSGLRGLVVELTEELVTDYVRAFLAACTYGDEVHVGWDLRPSSPQIAAWVLDALQDAGVPAVSCGPLPTPALALSALRVGAGAVMVTGSHIPADRNGLKFYVPTGEITKADEVAIQSALGRPASGLSAGCRSVAAAESYVARYVAAYGTCLTGLRVGVYQHSSVARDLMMDVFEALGATPVAIARSDSFIPVDTEALDPETKTLFAGWFEAHALDVLVSTDGDADRPMVVDDAQRVVPGDVLGAITAQALGAHHVCTPVSSNTMISDARFGFDRVALTRIGSPFVIAAMEEALAEDPDVRVVGYEANGGFLLGFEAEAPAGPLSPLMTRDCLLPIIAPLAKAVAQGRKLSSLVDALPPRFTAADRLQGIETDRSKAFIRELSESSEARADFFEEIGFGELALDTTDGLRLRFVSGDIVHLRPSGNAPEFRCYAEADTREVAETLVDQVLSKVYATLQ